MDNLIVPVYLNQKLVFDLIAMIQGGISTVTTVKHESKNSSQDYEKVSAGFGLSEAFSTLLKIDLSANKENKKEDGSTTTSSHERVHTPASLFFQLRNLLIQNKNLKTLSDNYIPQAGDFIEFEGFLNRNPIIETLDSLSEMISMAESFKTAPSIKSKKSQQPSSIERLKPRLRLLSESLKAGDTIDLTSNNIESKYSAVITVESTFLNDPLMSDLVDGQFKVIGKVIRSVNENDEPINLLRKTALSKMPTKNLDQFINLMAGLSEEKGFDFPVPQTKVSGPAIQIIPIAIYA